MASLAGMLQQRGFYVTGSDAAAYPPMSDFLHSLNIAIAEPFTEGNLHPHPDLVVVGNAMSRGNVELEYILDRKVPYCSLPQMLHQEFLRGKEVLVVAGTHGKTTTTSMLSWIFEVAGKQPSFLIGGIAENFGSSFQLGAGEHFILEGDEYDTAFFDKGPKFMHYFPDSAILTSVEFDHADIYKDLDAVETAFKRLVNLVPRRGKLIAYTPATSVDRVINKAFCEVERYGQGDAPGWGMNNLKFGAGETSWSVTRAGQRWCDFEFSLGGEYNVWNATAAAAMAAHYGIAREHIREALRTFKSVKRRLEVRAEVNGITVIDDFAHHPTAIAATLQALRARYPGRRLWAILEPRSNTLRRNVLQPALIDSLSKADEVVVAEIFKADAIPADERLDLRIVEREVRKRGVRIRISNDADSIVNAVAPEMRAGDVVAILSNGGFGGIYEKLPQALQRIAEAAAPLTH